MASDIKLPELKIQKYYAGSHTYYRICILDSITTILTLENKLFFYEKLILNLNDL